MDKTNVMVEFLIIGDDFPPHFITEKLSIEPTKYHIKGEKGTYNQQMKWNVWCINTAYEESLDINVQLSKILNVIKGKTSELKYLKTKYSLEYTIGIVIVIENKQTPAMHLESEVIKFANEIEAEFDIDLYVN